MLENKERVRDLCTEFFLSPEELWWGQLRVLRILLTDFGPLRNGSSSRALTVRAWVRGLCVAVPAWTASKSWTFAAAAEDVRATVSTARSFAAPACPSTLRSVHRSTRESSATHTSLFALTWKFYHYLLAEINWLFVFPHKLPDPTNCLRYLIPA